MAAKKSSNLTYANNAFVSGHITAFYVKINSVTTFLVKMYKQLQYPFVIFIGEILT